MPSETLGAHQINYNTLSHQMYKLAEFTVPNVFIVLPEYTPCYNPADWCQLNYRLYFLCECEDDDDERHLAFHEGYQIKQPREFFRRFGPYLCKILKVVKHAISIGSFIIPQLSSIASRIPTSVIPEDQYSWDN